MPVTVVPVTPQEVKEKRGLAKDAALLAEVNKAMQLINNQLNLLDVGYEFDFSCIRHAISAAVIPYIVEKYSAVGWEVDAYTAPGNDHGVVIAWPA